MGLGGKMGAVWVGVLATWALLAARPGLAEDAPVVPEPVAYAQRGFHDVLLRCPSRLWPRFLWNELQLLLSSPSSPDAWLINRSRLKPVRVPKTAALRELFEPGFNFDLFEYRGRRTIAINLDGLDGPATFRLAVRELFRDAAQSEMIFADQEQRGTYYPLLAEPRYLRQMAFRALVDAFEISARLEDASESLGEAQFWLRRWRSEFPEERALATDTAEGTALYVELLALVYNETSCRPSTEEFWSAFERLARPSLRIEPGTTAEEEGRILGAIASFELAFIRQGWERQIGTRFTPTELVVQGMKERPMSEDSRLREAWGRWEREKNDRLARTFAAPFAALHDPKYARVSVPASWQRGVFQPRESYVLRAQPDLSLLLPDRSLRFTGEGGEVRLAVTDVLLQSAANECNGMIYFLVPKSEIQGRPREFRHRNGERSFRFRGTERVVDGLTWICPRE